jgi:hypothetical protein
VQFELNRVLAVLVTRKLAGRLFAVSAVADLETFETPAFHDRLGRAWSTDPMRSMQVAQSVVGLVSSTATVGLWWTLCSPCSPSLCRCCSWARCRSSAFEQLQLALGHQNIRVPRSELDLIDAACDRLGIGLEAAHG